MKKTVLLFGLLIAFSSLFSQKSSLITDFQQKSRQAYLNYADAESHKQIKNNKAPIVYDVGDTRNFWRYDLSVMPPGWINEPAICKAVGDQSYVFVASSEWDVNINQDDVDQIMAFLEDSTLNTTEYGIVSMDTMLFGNIPDEIDNDPKVIFYFSALGSYNGSVFDGYFSDYNQMTETEAQQDNAHSNECEMLFMSCDPVNPTAISTLSVLSHELQHLIHWGYDLDEDTWLNEGMSELAMVVFGNPDPISSFPNNPNNNLTVWEQQWADYVKVQLFFTYLYEVFGADFTKNITQNPENSITSINTALAVFGDTLTFEDVFDNWVLANFINDTTFDVGQFGYTLLNLPNFAFTDKDENYPINISTSVDNCAAKYYKIPNDYLQQFDFDFENPENWNVNLLLYNENDSIVQINQLDINQTYILLQEDWTLNNIYYSLSNHYEGSSFNSCITDITFTGASNNELLSSDFSFINKSNSVTLIIPSAIDDKANITIFDVNGKQLFNTNSYLKNGLNFVEIDTGSLLTGIYMININTSLNHYQVKFVKYYTDN